jgi:O-antigen/teichoic acid export membrane protein
VIQILFGGLAQAFGRLLPLAIEDGALTRFFHSVRVNLRNATLVILAAGALAVPLLGMKFQTSFAFSTIALMLAVVSGWIVSINAIQNSARERMIVSGHLVFDTWLRLFLSVLLVKNLGNSALITLFSYLISSVIVFTSHIFFIAKTIQKLSSTALNSNRDPKKHVGPSWTRQSLEFAWPFSAWGIFTWVQQSSDRWSLQVFSGEGAVGHYMVLYQLGFGPITMAVGMLISLISPLVFERAGDGSDTRKTSAVARTIRRASLFAFAGTMLGFCVLLPLHQLVFQLSVGPEYRLNSWLLPWMWLAGGVFAIGQILSLQPLAELTAKKLLFPKIGTALIGVGLNVAGAAAAGLPGVVFAQLAFSVIYLAWIMALNTLSRDNHR